MLAADGHPIADPSIHRCKRGRWWLLLPVHPRPRSPLVAPPPDPRPGSVMALDPGMYRHLATTMDDSSKVTTADLPWPKLWRLQDRIDQLAAPRRGGARQGRYECADPPWAQAASRVVLALRRNRRPPPAVVRALSRAGLFLGNGSAGLGPQRARCRVSSAGIIDHPSHPTPDVTSPRARPRVPCRCRWGMSQKACLRRRPRAAAHH